MIVLNKFMNKKFEAYLVFAFTTVIGFIVGTLFFRIFIDTTLVPLIGMRPIIAAATVSIVYIIIYKLVDNKYHFKEKWKGLKKSV